jgi:hypothetical protein
VFLYLTLVHFATDETSFFLAGIFVRVVQEIEAPKHFNVIQFQRSFGELKTQVNKSPLAIGRFALDGYQGEQVFLQGDGIRLVIQIHSAPLR